jgi:hypothetical protein
MEVLAAKGEAPVRDLITEHQQNDLQLTDKEPLLSIPLTWREVTNSPEVLTLSIKEVRNPSLRSVQIVSYFEAAACKCDIGRFSLYPADHPGTFKLRTTTAIKELLRDHQGRQGPVFLSLQMVLGPKRQEQTADATVVLRMGPPRLGRAQ